MPDTADLLRQREYRGVRLALIARIVVLGFGLPVEFLAGSAELSGSRMLVYAGFATGLIAYGLLLLTLLRTGRTARVGLAAVLADVALMALMVLVWWLSSGDGTMPPAAMLKTGLAGVMAVFIALNAIALRPLYPLAVMAGMLAILLVLLGVALADPDTVWTFNVVAATAGPAVAVPLVAGDFAALLIVGCLVAFATLAARRLMLDGIRFEKTTAQLGRYFSPAVRDTISDAGDAFLRPGGRSQNVAVLFCDIRDFTGLAETLSPQDLIAFLSDYQRRMVAAVFAHGGTLDKFIGDAIMATFGTPETAPDDAHRAVAAAIAMRGALAELNRERTAAGKSVISHGTAVHYGPVIVGNVGTAERLEYTVIGNTVNVAAMIADLCRPTGEDLLVSETVRAQLGDGVAMRAVPVEEMRGRKSPVAIYAVDAGAGDVSGANVRPDFGREG